MKKIIIIINLLYISVLNAGAPAPKDLNSLPKSPHYFNNVTNLSIGVEWNEGFISKVIENNSLYKITKPIKGGISVFKSKNHKFFADSSGSYIWVDVIEQESNKIARLVLTGIYGPDNLITDVMELVYNLNVYNGSNKFMLINNKASVRANVRKKNVLNLVLETSDNCNKASGNYNILSRSSNGLVNKNIINWSAEKVCEAKPKSLIFNGILKDYKINKLLWAEVSERKNFTINKSIK